MWLPFLIAAAGGGCGGCGGRGVAGADAGSADDGAVVQCSAPSYNGVPPATHGGLVAYNQFVAGADRDFPDGDNPRGLFIDQAGVAYVGTEYFRRFDLDGNEESASRTPTCASGARVLDVHSPAQYPGGYAALTTDTSLGYEHESSLLCRIVDDTWPDPSECVVLTPFAGRISLLRWHDDAFQVITPFGAAFFSADGVPSRHIQFDDPEHAALAVEFLRADAVLYWYGRSTVGRGCTSFSAWTVPASYEPMEGKSDPLIPDDYAVAGAGNPEPSTTAGDSVAFVAAGDCVTPDSDKENGCFPRTPTWRTTFLTIIGADGEPAVLRQPLPTSSGGDQLTFDGEHLVLLHPVGAFASLLVLDLQGTVVRVGRVALDFSAAKDLDQAKLVAVAPNDYVMAYSVAVSRELWIARFQLVPL